MAVNRWSFRDNAAQTERLWLERLLVYQPALNVHLQDLLADIITYLPRVLAQSLLDTPSSELIYRFVEGTVMFADIDGFTPLAERFSQIASQEGAEELTELVNRFLDILITTTLRYGGDLQKFGGDAGLVLFTGGDYAQRAAAAALDVQQEMAARMSEVETSLGTFPLHIAIGLGSGRLVGMGMGPEGSREWVISGPPLRSMGTAQEAAPAGGVVADAATLALCGDQIDYQPMEQGMGLIKAVKMTAGAAVFNLIFDLPETEPAQRLEWMLERLDAVSPYLSTGLLERLTAAPDPKTLHLWSEHRQVTILMLSLSGFPDLTSYWGDLEGLRRGVEQFSELFMQAWSAIDRYGGVVNKIGIGPQGAYLMALFGAPNAHEDDPLRAILAALELQEVSDVPLRLGINTGFVFAGDVGAEGRREYTVMGDEVNLAYRLMSFCRPGQIWLGPRTARHPTVARRVEGGWGNPTQFKGKRDLITPFIARGVRTLLESGNEVELPLIGREAERQRLVDASHAGLAGTSQVLLLQGAPGIGKSRLVQEAGRLAEAAGLAVYFGAAPSYGSHFPYAVWEAPLTALLDLDGLSATPRLNRFLSELQRYQLEVWGALLAPLVGLEAPASPEVAALSPVLREQQRAAALWELWRLAAMERPSLLILENAQWMPEPALLLLDALIERMPAGHLVVLITYRDEPGLADRWLKLPADQRLVLEPLSSKATTQLIREVAGKMALPQDLERWIVKRGGGIPLFATEAVRTLIASGMLEEREGHWQLTHPLSEITLPDTAFELIQSRIDQLEPPNRHLLRSAAAVGEQMTMAMLIAGYADESRGMVVRRLPQLIPLGLLYGDPEQETLIFRQPLIREVAYRGLPYRMQRLIHRRVAEYLEHYRDRATSNWLTLLAYHAFEGRMWEIAVWSNLDLGRRALDSYLTEQALMALRRVLEAADAGRLEVLESRFEAHSLLSKALTILGRYEEALSHLDFARDLLPTDHSSVTQVARIADLEYHKATILEYLGRYRDGMDSVERGLALPEVLNLVEGARLMMRGGALSHRLGNYEQGEIWARRSVDLAQNFPGDDARKVVARSLYILAYLVFRRGDPQQGLTFGEESLSIYIKLQDLMGEIDARNNLLLICLGLGRWGDAVIHGERALSLARRTQHVEAQAKVAANLGEVYRHRGQLIEARQAYQTAREIAHAKGLAYGEAMMENNLAAVALQSGDLAQVSGHLERAEALFAAIGAEEGLPELYRCWAIFYLVLNDLEMAEEWGNRSLHTCDVQGVQQEAGITWRVMAEIALARQDWAAAEEALHQSITRLQAVGDQYGEMQAVVVAARLALARKNVERARELLQQAAEAFEHQDARGDLQKVREFLADLKNLGESA